MSDEQTTEETETPKPDALSAEHRALLECHVLRRNLAQAQGQIATLTGQLAQVSAEKAQGEVLAFARRLAAEYGFDAERDAIDVASGKITRKG